MKKGMKLMVMTLVVAMLLSMSAFAATVSYTSLVPEEINDGADYSITVNYSATGYNTGDQVTLLVLTEDDEIIFDATDATKPTNVAYIDQATIAGETGSFTFTVAKSFITSNDVYVKLGATAQATAAAGTYTFETTTPDGNTVNVTVNHSVANAFPSAGATTSDLTLITVVPETALADGKVIKVNGVQMFYKRYNEVTKYIALVSGFDEATAVFTVEDGTAQQVIFGDVNGGGMTSADALMVNRYAGGMTIPVFTNNPEFAKISADVNADGKVTSADALMINRRSGGMNVPFAAENK